MRLRLLTIAGAATLALAAPSAALAHHGHGRHGHKHHAKAHHARFEHIGASGISAPTTTPPPPPPPTAPTTTPVANAAKVVSFKEGVLTLALNNTEKTQVTGKVTSETNIECVSEASATPTPSGEPTDGSPGDDSGSGDDQSRGDMSQSGDKSEQSSDQTDQEDSSDDDGASPTAAPEPPCDTSLLTEGREVRSAELRIGPSGDEFENLVLVR